MASPFASLAKTLGKAFNGVFFDATLTRDGPATGPAYDPTPGAPTTYTCKALMESYAAGIRGQGLVGATDVKVMILATSLATDPLPLDRISVPDQKVNGIIAPEDAMGVKAVSTDPARAIWNCRVVT
jgi:hypothetical protein